MFSFKKWFYFNEVTGSKTGTVIGARDYNGRLILIVRRDDGSEITTSPLEDIEALNISVPENPFYKYYKVKTRNSIYKLAMNDEDARTILPKFYDARNNSQITGVVRGVRMPNGRLALVFSRDSDSRILTTSEIKYIRPLNTSMPSDPFYKYYLVKTNNSVYKLAMNDEDAKAVLDLFNNFRDIKKNIK